ncbi:MAG: hypothetical protein WAM60_17465 [Candidatus Promineifilaceae bacterium]
MKVHSHSFRRLLFGITLLIMTSLLLGCRPADQPEPVREETEAFEGAGGQNIAAEFEENGDSAVMNPILFVTQVPIRDDFATIGSTFANQMPSMQQVGRGGDLWIRYPNGDLKNLTQLAGYGSTGEFQDDDAIAVRDPAVHWDGNKAVFSMVIGAPEQQYEWEDYYWQLYEVTGLGPSDTPVITKVPNQPENYNNISPVYASDDSIIFTSDRPHNGAAHLYPQLDEYEETPTVTGLWKLNPSTGALLLLNHAPSGDFTPIVDSFGRVVFTQWDHLQQDQQADSDAHASSGGDCYGGYYYGTFNYSNEGPNAVPLDDRTEVFPEPRSCRDDLLDGTNLVGHSFNHFFPWQVSEDGTGSEVLNHLGRHDLHDYISNSINDDPNVVEYYGQYPRFNPNSIENMFQIAEDPMQPGRYYGIEAPEFGTHAAGQVIRLDAPPMTNADHIAVVYATHPDTAGTDDTPNNSGHYRDPLAMSDGSVIAAHTFETGEDADSGPSLYDFRLRMLTPAGNGYLEAGAALTSGINKTVTYWDPDAQVTYSGNLWELNPVEVRPRTRPTAPPQDLPGPEQQIFDQAGVSVTVLQAYLQQSNLALLVSRNVTTRDDLDLQQAFNLSVPGGVQTIGAAGTIYDVVYIQFFQGDLLRGIGWEGPGDDPSPGRRVLAQILHDPAVHNPPSPGPAGSAVIAPDGSMAAFVPAQRALSWQLTDGNGDPVVRERYWLTFQPGEIRVCTSCHGLSELDQAGHAVPNNPPQALLDLLQFWQTQGSFDYNSYLPTTLDNE